MSKFKVHLETKAVPGAACGQTTLRSEEMCGKFTSQKIEEVTCVRCLKIYKQAKTSADKEV